MLAHECIVLRCGHEFDRGWDRDQRTVYSCRDLMIHVTMVAMAIQYDGCSAFYPCFCPTLLKKRLLTPIF